MLAWIMWWMLGDFAGRGFAVFLHDDTHQACIRFGYELFGRRFYQVDIEIERIKSVAWSFDRKRR